MRFWWLEFLDGLTDGWIFRCLRKGQPISQSVLSLLVKTSHHKYLKIWPPPKFIPQNTMLVIAFRTALTPGFQKKIWLSGQVNKWQKLLGVVNLKSSTLAVYCLSSWFAYQKQKQFSTLCILCGLILLSWLQGIKYISPCVWPRCRKPVTLIMIMILSFCNIYNT